MAARTLGINSVTNARSPRHNAKSCTIATHHSVNGGMGDACRDGVRDVTNPVSAWLRAKARSACRARASSPVVAYATRHCSRVSPAY
jgi:hypothetical protein